MNDPIKEQLSAYLDGELPAHETELLLRRLERDATPLERQCSRYHAIGDAMRGGRGITASAGFAARVRAAVAGESSVAGVRRELPRVAPGWLRPAAGLGIAAGVAAVAVLSLQTPTSDQPAVVPVAQSVTASTTGPVDDVTDRRAPSSYVVPAGLTSGGLVVPTRLTNYVVAHSEYSSPLGRRNVLTGLLADSPSEPMPATDADPQTDDRSSSR